MTDADPKYRDAAWLREQYVEQQQSTYDIADELGCDKSTVLGWLKKHGIETRDSGKPTPDERLEDADWLREQYVEQQQSTYDIADELGCSGRTVLGWLKKHGIETRGPVLTGLDNPRWRGGSYPYGSGWTESKKRTVRERDDFACVRCGRTQDSHREEYGEKLHVHHIVKAREIDDPAKRNAVENLVTLCRDCHRKYEHLADAGLRPQITGVTAND